ncbi:NAD(P)-binding protein [Hypoxylon sp. EC38]|nr:NAD(P)-binding protein [Hypoxylon sp. EC38]
MKAPFPSLTPTWHNGIYPAIEYTSKRLTHEGETVIITGAGSGICREIAIAFATAGAKHIILIGRTLATLNETASLVSKANTSSRLTTFEADVTDEASVKRLAAAIDTWNVVIHGAGFINPPTPIIQVDVDDYWKSYETNVKSTIMLVKYLVPKANQFDAAFLTMTAGGIQFPIEMLVGNSGYLVSKMALAKTTEFLAQENPNIFFASVHPGMVDTDIFRRSGATPEAVPTDTPQLAAGFILWLTKPEAKFLKGKTVWANWDIDELKGMQEVISTSGELSIGLTGWPFATGKSA